MPALPAGWYLSGRVAEVFAPILRTEIDKALRSGVQVDGVLLSELESGERVAAESKSRRNPDNRQGPAPDSNNPRAKMSGVDDGADVVGLRRAAICLGCSPQAVHERCRRGTLPHRRVGTLYVFAASDLDAKGQDNG
ncbi:MAG: helix-turn-helix domain-containing protein [Deltaproteobacteria bacterium]